MKDIQSAVNSNELLGGGNAENAKRLNTELAQRINELRSFAKRAYAEGFEILVTTDEGVTLFYSPRSQPTFLGIELHKR